MIPLEPMALVMNMGMADNFAPQNKSIREYMPAFLRFDYVRIYQDPDDESVTCDPPGWETTQYIKDHPKAYANQNYTTWYVFLFIGFGRLGCLLTDFPFCRDDAGYHWPKNSYMHDCAAK
jgi:hypothetical protein